jgi:hypothetical protein
VWVPAEPTGVFVILAGKLGIPIGGDVDGQPDHVIGQHRSPGDQTVTPSIRTHYLIPTPVVGIGHSR